MRIQKSLLLLFAVLFVVQAFKISTDAQQRKLNGWKQIQLTTAQDATVPIKVGLRQKNLDVLNSIFWDVSNPKSKNYGKYLSVDEITELIAPDEEVRMKAVNWIKSVLGDVHYTEAPNRDYLLMSLTVAQTETLFGVKLLPYSHEHSRHIIYRSQEPYNVPENLKEVIHMVDGVSNFPPVKPRKRSAGLRDDGQNVTPLVIKKLYNVNITGQVASNGQAVAEFEQDYFFPSDLPIFEKTYGLPIQEVAQLIGPNDPQNGYLGEATLDVEYIIGVGTGVPTWVFSIGSPGLDLIAWALNVTGTPGAPNVHSVSWGSGEGDFDGDYINRTEVELQKLGVMGYSVLVASGDEGTGHTGFFCGTFDPTYPATSPYVTAVGGTYLDTANSSHEIGWVNSGGGFSTVFPRPSYQDAAVQQFFSQGNLPDQSYYNPNGRGIPDVSALATNFQVCVQGSFGPESGTSAAAPTFAGVISLVNDVRLQQGKPLLGFLNPLLYQLKSVGTDIVEGENTSGECPKGFSAVAGWDAITGLGTPQLDVLLAQLV